MTTLREAAQQALEALEHHGGHLPWNAFVEVRKDLRAALAEPVQEPVAYVDQRIHGWPDCFVMEAAPPHTTPLYTAPPPRKPLTQEELDELAMDEDGLPNSHLEFARAIERAHGIGGDK